jgi:hypothetical protein
MKVTATALALALLANSAQAATIVQELSQRPELSQVAAFAKDRPEWSAPGNNKTLIAPTNTAVTKARADGFLPANHPGAFFLPNQGVDHRSELNYQILKTAETGLLFDNYVPQGPPEIHLRTSTNNGLATGQVQCDDGWLYISDIAIEPAVRPSIAAARGPPQATAFIELFKTANLVDALDGLKDVTIFAPTNAAVAAAQAQLANLSPNQLAAVLAAHIGNVTRFSTELNPGAWPTLLDTYSLNLTVGNEAHVISDAPFASPVDTSTSAGVIHVIGKVIIPPNLNLSTPLVKNSTSSSSAAPSATPSATTASKPSSTTTTTPTAKVESTSGAIQSVGSYLSALAAGVLGLVFAV